MASPMMRLFFLLSRFALGGVFVYAGVVKIWNFAGHHSATPDFYEDIVNFHLLEALLPARFASDLAMIAAIYLPWLELSAGLALLLHRAVAGAAALIALLTTIFLGALASAWARGLEISCGCFGHETLATNYPLHLLGNAALLALALSLLLQKPPASRAPAGSAQRGRPVEIPT